MRFGLRRPSSARVTWTATSTTHVLSALADLDGDGRLDAYSSNDRHYDNVVVSPGLRDGQFASSLVITVRRDPVRVAGGDLDGDGLLDLVSAHAQTDSIAILLNDSRSIPARVDVISVVAPLTGGTTGQPTSAGMDRSSRSSSYRRVAADPRTGKPGRRPRGRG